MTKRILRFIAIVLIFVITVNYKIILKRFYPVYYEETIIKYSKQYNLNPNLIFSLIKVESKFNPCAKSNKGAIGLMQITPGTGAYIAKLIGDNNFSILMLYDPEINIKYGCFYLSKLLYDFNNNMDCALAAYNGGEGNVRKWIKNSGNGYYLKIDELPFDETRKYVKKVKQNYKIYNFLYSDENLYIFKLSI